MRVHTSKQPNFQLKDPNETVARNIYQMEIWANIVPQEIWADGNNAKKIIE